MNTRQAGIADRIQQALEARSVRPVYLAQLLGVSRSAVSTWLRGEKLSLNSLAAIAEKLDVSLNWLALGIEPLDISDDSLVSKPESDLIRLVRHFGHEATRPMLDMVLALRNHTPSLLKTFKAFDLISRVGIPIAVLDADGNLVFSNVYHNQLLGLDESQASEIIGAHFTTWIPKIFHRGFRSILEEASRKGYASYNQLKLTCPITGKPRPIAIYAHAISDDSGSGVQLMIQPIDHE